MQQPLLTHTSMLTIFTMAPPETFMGAACGALMHMLSSKTLPRFDRIVTFAVSFTLGILSSNTGASVIQGGLRVLLIDATISPAVGAFFAAAVIVSLVTRLIRNPLGFADRVVQIFSKESEK